MYILFFEWSSISELETVRTFKLRGQRVAHTDIMVDIYSWTFMK